MQYNNYNEFKDNLIQTRKIIMIPNLNIRINKFQFIKNGIYDFSAEEDYLQELYNKHK